MSITIPESRGRGVCGAIDGSGGARGIPLTTLSGRLTRPRRVQQVVHGRLAAAVLCCSCSGATAVVMAMVSGGDGGARGNGCDDGGGDGGADYGGGGVDCGVGAGPPTRLTSTCLPQ